MVVGRRRNVHSRSMHPRCIFPKRVFGDAESLPCLSSTKQGRVLNSISEFMHHGQLKE